MRRFDFSEAELRERFINSNENLNNNLIYQEVPVFSRSVDLVIQDPISSYITAIEFKMHDWKRAILQVQSVGLCFDYLYICLPKPKTSASFQAIASTCGINGVGLYFYDTETDIFEIEVESPKTKTVWETQRKRVMNYLEAEKHGQSITHSKV